MNRIKGKRFWARLLTLIMVCNLFAAVPVMAETSAEIEIGTAEELMELSKRDFEEIKDAEILLTADIDMADMDAIAPFGAFVSPEDAVAFNGVFDGNGYKIENLTISAENDCAGLFSYVGTEGVVENLILTDFSVSASGCDHVGAIAGCLTGTVSRCSIEGSVSAAGTVGGVAGILHGGTIENCLVDVDIDASGSCAGGLFGDANYNIRDYNVMKTAYEADPENNPAPNLSKDGNGSPLTECLEGPMNVVNNLILGNLSAKNKIGGLTGDVGNSLTSNMGDFSGNVIHAEELTSKGATYGYAYAWWTNAKSKAVEDENLYCETMTLIVPADTTAFVQTGSTLNFKGVSADALESQDTYKDLGWDFKRIWDWDEDNLVPFLRDVKVPVPGDLGPLYIDTAEELADFFADDFYLNSEREVYLDADIDMSGYAALQPWGITEDGVVTAFNGFFDGDGHVIRNLTIEGVTDEKDAVDCTGFFAYLGEDGKVLNLGFENINVEGNRNTGAIAGCLTGSVSECYVTGSVYGKSNVGGMAGILYDSSIENCWLDTAVSATGAYAGGLFGSANYNNTKANNGSPLTQGTADGSMNVANTLVLGQVSGSNYVGGMNGEVGNSRTSAAFDFTGNVIWVDTVTSVSGSAKGAAYGEIYGWWAESSERTVTADQNNVYYDGIVLEGPETNTVAKRDYVVFGTRTESELKTQKTYENAPTAAAPGLGWDFDEVWVWSAQLEHPVLRGVAAPAVGEELDQDTPASLVTTFADDPKTTRAFTWFTDSGINGTVVQYVPVSDYVEGDETVFAEEKGSCEEIRTGAHGETRNIHKVNLTDLEPGTAYCYRAGDGRGNWSEVYTFETEAEDADSFTFFSMTDTQGNGFKKYGNYENYVKVLEAATAAYPDGAFILHGGDMIQNNYLEHYDKIFELTQDYAASIPTMVTPGNHEMGKDNLVYTDGVTNFNSHYQFPDNGPDGCSETVYSFDYGDAHIAVLDSNKVKTGGNYSSQLKWITEDMNATDKAWKIVSIHVGPYNNYGEGTTSLIKKMDELEIDLVLFGHNHAFLRSNLIKDGVTDPSVVDHEFTASEGRIYYSSGCAGGTAGQGGGADANKTDPRDMAKTYFSVLGYEKPSSPVYGAITVTADTLKVTSYAVSTSGADSRVIDEFIIRKPVLPYTAPEAKEDLVYNGRKQELISAGSAEIGTMLYSLDGETYSEEIPVGKAADTYQVWYKVVDEEGQDLMEPAFVIAEIAPAEDHDYRDDRRPGSRYPDVDVVGEGGNADVGKSTVTIRPDAGYEVDKVTVNGKDVEVPENGRLTDLNSTDDVLIYFKESVIDVEDEKVPAVSSEWPFKDVTEVDWFYPAVRYVYENALMSGMETDLFGHGTSLTRGMITTIIWRMEDKPAAAGVAPFLDVTSNMYYAEAIAWGAEEGIVAGYDAVTFGPDDPVTREQLAAILYRYAQYKGMDAVTMAENLGHFSDVDQISAYAVPALNWAVGEGIMNGNDDGTLNPGGNAQRSHAAQMLMKFMKNTAK